MKLFKILAKGKKSCHGGNHVWEPYEWYKVQGELIPCQNGFHLSRGEDLLDWLDEEVWEAEFDGEAIAHGNKLVVRRARITRQCNWNYRIARLFACDCAQQVVHLCPNPAAQRCIDVARRYASQKASYEELVAAREAALSISCDAAAATAREAAWVTSRLISYEAAIDAAWASARAAAKAAAGDAPLDDVWDETRKMAWNVAWNAARKRQVRRLIQYLSEEV
jgi:hypothetical protein